MNTKLRATAHCSFEQMRLCDGVCSVPEMLGSVSVLQVTVAPWHRCVMALVHHGMACHGTCVLRHNFSRARTVRRTRKISLFKIIVVLSSRCLSPTRRLVRDALHFQLHHMSDLLAFQIVQQARKLNTFEIVVVLSTPIEVDLAVEHHSTHLRMCYYHFWEPTVL